MVEESVTKRREDERYRALLGVSNAIASEPTLQAVLHSISALLSKIISFESIALLLLDEKRGTVRLHALETGIKDPGIDIGTELSLKETAVAQTIERQEPILVEDLQPELDKVPELRQRLNLESIRSAYILPVSTSRRKLGALIFGAGERGAFSKSNVELMTSVASHISVALDGALLYESAEEYQRELARERDRLKLLLEINNHVVSRLEMDDLFKAAAASIRKFFGNDLTGFWLLEEDSRHVRCAVLDFPTGRNSIASIEVPELSQEQLDRMSANLPIVETVDSLEREFPTVVQHFRAESIVSIATVPLVASRGPFGVISLGSRRTNAFSQQDLDLLTQVATQISLAFDNALAYGRLNASRNHLEDQRVYLESEIVSEYGFEDIIGKSRALRKVLDQVAIVAPTDSSVIIHGETGTGKELIARAIHRLSSRTNRTFVRLNCAAIPSGLLESELFGHERGAFTGALVQKRGRFELADQGSLFLDEIGDISLELQPKLLRAIQEKEFERLGSARTIRVNVRLIAATHKDLPNMIREGTFREDLFYRLNVFPIEVPPLRERREDIPLLVHYFVSRLCRRMQKQITTIPRGTMDALVSWDWPGNVRELENYIERAVILTQGSTLQAPLGELNSFRSRTVSVASFRDSERAAIINALKIAQGKLSGRNGAAEYLGLKRTTLQNKMRKLGITRET